MLLLGGDTRISHYYPHTAHQPGPGLVSLTVSLFLPRVLTRKYEQGAEETEAAAAAGLKLGAEQWPGPSIIQASCSLYTSLGSGHSRYCAQK